MTHPRRLWVDDRLTSRVVAELAQSLGQLVMRRIQRGQLPLSEKELAGGGTRPPAESEIEAMQKPFPPEAKRETHSQTAVRKRLGKPYDIPLKDWPKKGISDGTGNAVGSPPRVR